MANKNAGDRGRKTSRRKSYTGGLTKQKRALEAVADARQNRRIRKADTAAKVKAIFRDGVLAMDAIPVDNSPIWTRKRQI